jgi:hypothetical protein
MRSVTGRGDTELRLHFALSPLGLLNSAIAELSIRLPNSGKP